MSVEKNLAIHAKQPWAQGTTGAERQFIEDMRKAAMCAVGYGWMQQIIEWEWQAQGLGAWGPYYFENLAKEQEKKFAALATVVYEQCSREGCHCPGEIKGECAFCVLSVAIKGYVPDGETDG